MKSIITCVLAINISLFCSAAASADVVVTFSESGGDVVSSFQGSIDLTGASQFGLDAGGAFPTGFVSPTGSFAFNVGAAMSSDAYSISAPGTGLAFGPGTGSESYANFETGDTFLFANFNGTNGTFGGFVFVVPLGYVTGETIMGSATYTGESLSSLGITPGTYSSTFGANTVTLNAIAVPEPTGFACISLSSLVCCCLRRKRL